MYVAICNLNGSLGQQQGTLANLLYPIEVRIVSTLFEVAQRLQITPGQDRNTEILVSLDQLGARCGYPSRIYYSPSQQPRWLFDLVWYLIRPSQSLVDEQRYPEASAWAKVAGLKLACEAEKSGKYHEVLEDFYKLVVADSELRLFVHSNQENTVSLCKSVVPQSRGKRYLLIGFDTPKKSEFRIDTFTAEQGPGADAVTHAAQAWR